MATQTRTRLKITAALTALAMPFMGPQAALASPADPPAETAAPAAAPKAGGYPINVPDPNLKACLMLAAGTWDATDPKPGPNTQVMVEDIAHLTQLTCPPEVTGNISDLTGLEHLAALQSLTINNIDPSPDEGVKSLSPLTELWNLSTINLQHHRITTLDDLTALGNLASLDFSFNKLYDFNALGSKASIRRLNLAYNELWNMQPVETLSGLTHLDVRANHISSARPMAFTNNLQEVQASGQYIETTAQVGGQFPMVFEELIGDADPQILSITPNMTYDSTEGFHYLKPGLGMAVFLWGKPAHIASFDMSMQVTAFIGHTDVPEDSGFFRSIVYVAEAGISTGYDDGTFGYGDQVLREQMAAFIYRSNGSPTIELSECLAFPDVPDDSVFRKPICWMTREGLTTGYDDGRFGYGDPINREQAVMMMHRGSGETTDPALCTTYSDVPADSKFAPAICWASVNGVIRGYEDGRFGYGDPILREQMAAIFHRMAGPGPI